LLPGESGRAGVDGSIVCLSGGGVLAGAGGTISAGTFFFVGSGEGVAAGPPAREVVTVEAAIAAAMQHLMSGVRRSKNLEKAKVETDRGRLSECRPLM
jgi:hypothetical protein